LAAWWSNAHKANHIMAKPNPFKHLRSTDLRGLAKLATQATVDVTKIAEGVTQSVWSTLGAPSGKGKDQTRGTTRGITGLVYKSILSLTQLVGKGTESLLTSLQPLLKKIDLDSDTPQESAPREAVLAALNGVMGDRLAESDNPLATPMTLRFQNNALNWEAMPDKALLTGKVLVVIHGLCMNDLQWSAKYEGMAINHAETLATELGYTPIYVRYNTGLHTSQNGHELANQLELLTAMWPMPIAEISVLSHSMGGLVMRSAVLVAQQSGRHWVKKLKNIVFLGTPHHGAPLEKAGNWIDTLLGATPYSAPFKKLAELRSSGITDLRFGYVLDSDWQGQDRFKTRTKQEQDRHGHLPLPEGIACFTVAATLAVKRSLLADRLVGDGLVPLNSALGVHRDAKRCLAFAKPAQLIVYRTNHVALLGSAEVGEQLVAWLNPV
jgi:pimeloyl-ACP methyl ester carboxylesterase